MSTPPSEKRTHAKRGTGPALCGADYPNMSVGGPIVQTCIKCLAIQALVADELDRLDDTAATAFYIRWASKAWVDAQFTTEAASTQTKQEPDKPKDKGCPCLDPPADSTSWICPIHGWGGDP